MPPPIPNPFSRETAMRRALTRGRAVLRTAAKLRHYWLFALHSAAAIGLWTAAGCSTAPCADVLDCLCPGKFPADAKSPIGGVCIPQGGPAGGALGAPPPIGPALPQPPGSFSPPFGGDMPPPAPLSATPTPGIPPPGPW